MNVSFNDFKKERDKENCFNVFLILLKHIPIYFYYYYQPADTKLCDGSNNDDLAEQTDDEEDWNEFIPVRKSFHRVKSK